MDKLDVTTSGAVILNLVLEFLKVPLDYNTLIGRQNVRGAVYLMSECSFCMGYSFWWNKCGVACDRLEEDVSSLIDGYHLGYDFRLSRDARDSLTTLRNLIAEEPHIRWIKELSWVHWMGSHEINKEVALTTMLEDGMTIYIVQRAVDAIKKHLGEDYGYLLKGNTNSHGIVEFG